MDQRRARGLPSAQRRRGLGRRTARKAGAALRPPVAARVGRGPSMDLDICVTWKKNPADLAHIYVKFAVVYLAYKGWAAADELLPAVRFVARTCGRLSVAPSATQNLRLLTTKNIAQGQWDRMGELRSAGNAAPRARDLQEGKKQEWRWPHCGATWKKQLRPLQLDSTEFPTIEKLIRHKLPLSAGATLVQRAAEGATTPHASGRLMHG